ncbi:substrate-binding domain-containing protein [Nonomuraea jabiensis]|uniref:DNA-binding LacI/PurR family transcriptional regulator n=1 Tax=Nonomuraea jabiensis TaxID=882448 RepID=A0A7W9GGF6_9ACTN|nr:substrate-binding domain-containing protein [Nonomuraea jabiensis]MBB5783364.1 DNA-binding LacI/PurR family transcriptional regulator [Nonomuraea jabiensis]
MTIRTLVTRRSRRLGIVSFDPALYRPASTVYGIERAAREAGHFVRIVSLRTIDRAGVNDALGYLAEQGVDGVILVAPQRSAAQALADLPADLPAVAVEGRHEGDVSVVSVDQVEGARQATAHLLDLGHETVWHVRGPDDWLEAEERGEGWRAVLSAAGRAIPEALEGDWTPRSGYLAGKILAGRVSDVTAVFVANDRMALGLLRAFSEAGVKVPEQVSVVGFDDIPESAYFTPSLTTVRQDFDEVGRLSVKVLLQQVESAEPLGHARLVVAPRLIGRNSTARPRPA